MSVLFAARPDRLPLRAAALVLAAVCAGCTSSPGHIVGVLDGVVYLVDTGTLQVREAAR